MGQVSAVGKRVIPYVIALHDRYNPTLCPRGTQFRGSEGYQPIHFVTPGGIRDGKDYVPSLIKAREFSGHVYRTRGIAVMTAGQIDALTPFQSTEKRIEHTYFRPWYFLWLHEVHRQREVAVPVTGYKPNPNTPATLADVARYRGVAEDNNLLNSCRQQAATLHMVFHLNAELDIELTLGRDDLRQMMSQGIGGLAEFLQQTIGQNPLIPPWSQIKDFLTNPNLPPLHERLAGAIWFEARTLTRDDAFWAFSTLENHKNPPPEPRKFSEFFEV